MKHANHIHDERALADSWVLRHILYVDDDQDILSLVHLALETIGGFQVEICSHGSKALALAETTQPDLIMLDVMMPDIDGPTLLQQFKQHPTLCHVPVIFMTARVQPAERERYLLCGAVGIIPKPFNPISLPDDIRALWQQHQRHILEHHPAGIQLLREQYLQKLPAKRIEIEAFLQHARSGNMSLSSIQKMERMVHNLAGSAALYGYPTIGQAAQAIERLMISEPYSPDIPGMTEKLLAAMEQALMVHQDS